MSGLELEDSDMALVIRGAGNTEVYLPVLGGADMNEKMTSLVMFMASSHPRIERARSEVLAFIRECGL